MTAIRDELYRRALQLSEAERAGLAEQLIDSLDPADDDGVERAWFAEIEKRVEQLKAGTVETVSWESVKRELEGKASGDEAG